MPSDNDISVMIGADSSGLAEGLTQATSAVEQGVNGLKESFDTMTDGANNATTETASLFQRMADAVVESVSKMGEGVVESAKVTNEGLESINKSIEGVGKFAKTLSELAIGGIIGEQLLELGKASAEYAEQIELASQKTGIAGDSLEGLRFAASTANVGFDQLTSGLTKLDKATSAAEAGNKSLQAAFQAVGISMSDLKNMTPEQVLDAVANKFNGTKDNANKTAAAIALFGRAGAQLVPILDKGSSGLDSLKKEASDLGDVMGTQSREKALELAEEFKRVNAAGHGIRMVLSEALGPAMLAISQAFVDSAVKGGAFQEFAEGLGEVIKFVTDIASHFAQAFSEAGIIVGASVAQIVAAIHGDFSAIGAIQKEASADLQATAARYNKFRDDLSKPAVIPKVIDKNAQDGGIGTGTQAKDTLMAQLNEQLSALKANFEQESALQGQYVEFSKEQERQFWESKLSLAQAGSKDYLEIQTKINQDTIALNKQDFDAQVANLKAQEDAFKNNYDAKEAIAKKYADMMLAAYGKDSTQYAAAQKDIIKIDQERAAQQKSIAEEQETNASKIAQMQITTEEQKNASLLQQGKITNDQYYAAEVQLEDRLYALQVAALQKKLQIASQDPDKNPVEILKINEQIEQLEQQHQDKLVQIRDKADQASMKNWQQLTTTMENSFSTMVENVAKGSETISQGLLSMTQQVLDSLIKRAADFAANWVKQQIVALLSSKTTAVSGIAASASQAGAAAYASTAAIPIVGPAMAPASAAAAYAGAMAYEATASAAGGYDIPAGVNPVVQTHAQEMILPASIANPLRANLANGGGGGGGGDINIHAAYVDAQALRRMFTNNGAGLVQALQRQVRGFNTPGMAS